jgi:hypothetical protein
MQHEFKYKLDFYYQQALIYLITLMLYAGVRGTFFENSVTVVLKDPILYIIIFFVLQSFGLLLLNRIRDRKLIITDSSVIFQHRFNKIEIPKKEIEWIHIGKERGVQTAGRFQIVILKLKERRRTFRIRIGRYEKEKELIQQMHEIAVHIPKREKKKFPFRKRNDY